MFDRGVSFVPAGDPAGRAEVNSPVAYTVLPTTTWSQTTPLICTVGSASALTVVSVTGGTGAVSAVAGDVVNVSKGRTRASAEAMVSPRRRVSRPRAARTRAAGAPTIDNDETDTTLSSFHRPRRIVTSRAAHWRPA